MKDIELIPFQEEDIQLLSPIMKRSFDKDGMEFLGHPSGPPGYDNGDFLRKYGLDPSSSAYKIVYKGQPVGAVILWILPDHNNFLGCLFIDCELQDHGLGTAVWKMVEEMYPDTKVWNTETPSFTRRNHNFYINKCGFHVVRIEDPHAEYSSYRMQKIMS